MLLLEGLSLHGCSIQALFTRQGERARAWWRESVLLAGHVGGYLAAVLPMLPLGQTVVFVAVHQGLLGVYLGRELSAEGRRGGGFHHEGPA